MTSPVVMPAGHKIVASDLDAYENATGAWVTWVPAWTNVVVGNGTIDARYTQVGKTVNYYLRFILGSTSTVGTDPLFTFPAAPSVLYNATGEGLFPGQVFFIDTGVKAYQGSLTFSGGSTVRFVSWPTTLTLAGVTATAPFTWGTGDWFAASGTYEAA